MLYDLACLLGIMAIYAAIGFMFAGFIGWAYSWDDEDAGTYLVVMITWPAWIILYLFGFIIWAYEGVKRWNRSR